MTDAYHELLDDLSHTTTRIQEMTEKHGANLPVGTADSWGPAQIVAHMIDVEKLYRGRMRLILAQQTPYLKSWQPSVGPEGIARELRPQLEAFANERGETISMLMNLALKGWERTGIHDEFGELSVEDIVERLIEHDNEHLSQMEASLNG